MTFADLVEMEPELGKLLDEAKSHHQNTPDHFCANAVWYGYAGWPGLKPRVAKLVGTEARLQGTILNTHLAYDIAYDTISDALPDCRDCTCWVGTTQNRTTKG